MGGWRCILGEETFFLGGWGWLEVYFGRMGVGGHFSWVDGVGRGKFWVDGSECWWSLVLVLSFLKFLVT